MPPKTTVTQRSTSEQTRDQWSANPYKSSDPRREQFEVQQRIAQREAAVSRVGHAIAKDLRTHDFATMGGVVMGRNTTSTEFAATQKRLASTSAAANRSASMALRSPSAAAPADGTTATADGNAIVSPNGGARNASASVASAQHWDAASYNNNSITNASSGGADATVAGENTTCNLQAVPSRLRPPASFVEEALKIEGLTCSMVLQGGSLILAGTRGGEVVALNGFTSAEMARVSVTEPIQKCDRELEGVARAEGTDPNRRPQRKATRGDSEAHSREMTGRIASGGASVGERLSRKEHGGGAPLESDASSAGDALAMTSTYNDGDTLRGTARKDPSAKSGNEGAFPIAVGALGESSFVAFVLSNRKVRVFDAMTLTAVDEISFETDAEREAREEKEKNSGGANGEDGADASTSSNEDANASDGLPFAAVLPVDCSPDPIIFFVACSDRVVAFTLHQPPTLADRPRLAISRIKTYERLGLRLVCAATDCARTVVYAGDDNGDVWSIDVSDLMAIDSWPAVPPPPPPPNTRKEQRKGAAAARLTSPKRESGERREIATAVGAFGEFIFVGTSAGRVVVTQKQPYGERPLAILDEAGAHSGRIIGAVADERAEAVWFASELGEVTCWSLATQRLIYRTIVPTAPKSEKEEGGEQKSSSSSSSALLTSFAMLPHAITNKVWTVTISGINKVWLTEDHQTHDEMGVAHAHMEAVLARQERSMEVKEAEVAAAEETMLARLGRIVEAIAEQNRQRVLRAYYCAWVTARLKAITRRKREDAAEALNNNAVYYLARSYYLKLIANMTAQRERKQNVATVVHLQTQREDELRGRYFNSLRKYVHERRAAEHRGALATAVAAINGASNVAPFYFDKWRRFADQRRKAARQKAYLALIARVEERKATHSYFLRWQRAASAAHLRGEQRRTVAIIAESQAYRGARLFFTKWQTFIAERRVKAQRERWAAFLATALERRTIAGAFDALLRFRAVAARAREAAALAEAEAKKAALEVQFAAVAPLVDRREKVKALEDRLAALKAQRAALAKDEAAVSAHNGELRAVLASAPNPILEAIAKPSTSPSDDSLEAGEHSAKTGGVNPRRVALLKLMGRLRSAVIDLEADAPAITRVLAKAKADTVVATFDSYVADLKATILIPPTSTSVPTATSRLASDGGADDANANSSTNFLNASVMSGSGAAPAEGAQWPRGDSAVTRAVADAASLQAPLLVTIKAIVIAFDALSSAEVEALGPVADELLENGDALVLLGELLLQAVAKRKLDSPPASPSRSPRMRIVTAHH